MGESRICPVCENKIPEDATFECPYCRFELKYLDDKKMIGRRKKANWVPFISAYILVGIVLFGYLSSLPSHELTMIFYWIFIPYLGLLIFILHQFRKDMK